MKSIITGAARRRARRRGVVKSPPLDLSAEQLAALLAELTRDAAPALAGLERLAGEGQGCEGEGKPIYEKVRV